MKATYTFRKDFYHIYTGILDNKESFEATLQVLMDIIPDFLQRPNTTFLNTAIYENFQQIPDTAESHNTAFWVKVAAFEPCHDKAEKYLQFVLQELKKETSDIWENDTAQIGQQAAYQLAMADRRFIGYYTEMLKYWDMAHEVDQFEEIDDIISKYGWCLEVAELLYVRGTQRGATGQHGTEQLPQYAELIIQNNEPLEESDYFQKLIKSFFRGDHIDDVAKLNIHKRFLEASLNILKS